MLLFSTGGNLANTFVFTTVPYLRSHTLRVARLSLQNCLAKGYIAIALAQAFLRRPA